MAVLTLGILVLAATYALSSTVGIDPTPECTPLCEGGFCPLKLTLLDSEECVCRLMFMTQVKSNIRLKCKNDSVELRLPKRFRPEWESTLAIKGQDEQLTCYRVEKDSDISSTLETNNKTNKKIKIQCSPKDQILVQSVLLVNGYKRYDVYPSKGNVTGCRRDQHRTVSTITRNSKGCKCWSPNQVRIHPVGNSTLIVEWEPFYAHKDVRVRVEGVKPRRSKDDRDATLWNYQLCDKKLRNFTFTNFDPGTYVAMVGAQGCDCMLYTQSDRITIGEDTEVTNTLISNPRKKSHEEIHDTIIIIVVVGAFAVIGTLSLGLATFFTKKRRAEQYVPVQSEADEPRIIIAIDQEDQEDQENNDISHIATSIKTPLESLLNQPDIKIRTKEDIGDRRMASELIVLMSLQDYHTFQNPAIDECHWSSTITILRDYTHEEDDLASNLLVHVPRDIEHPCFNASRNDIRGENHVLSLRDALRHINPECDFDCDEYRDFVNSINEKLQRRDDEIKSILVLSGFVHKHHNGACLELVKILQQLDKRVAYAYDRSNRKDIQTEGPSKWTLDKLQGADLVVVVVSKFLYKLVDCYNKERDIPEFNQNLGICAPLAIKQITQMPARTKRPKIAYVSFGYESVYEDKIVEISRHLDSDMRYSLVETKHQTIVHNSRDDDGELHALNVFLSRLSTDRTSVNAACGNSAKFREHVKTMATMMANHPKWLERTYGSMESLQSFFTCSELSLLLPMTERSFSGNRTQYAETVV